MNYIVWARFLKLILYYLKQSNKGAYDITVQTEDTAVNKLHNELMSYV